MGDSDLLAVGRVRRAHGLTGEVVVELTTNRADRLDCGSVLRDGSTDESHTLEVMASRRDRDRWLVRFGGIGDRSAAERLTGTVLYAAPATSGDGYWVHELIGRHVLTGGEDRGEIVAVQANPASDLLVLESGALVPVRFVVDDDHVGVHVDAPPGLFDLP